MLKRKISMQRLRAQLICGVCLDFLREPKLLECAHSFCLECLVHVVQKQDIYRTPDSPLHENDVECPSCRQSTRLQSSDSDGVEALRTNFNLKELVEIVSKEENLKEMRGSLRVRSLSADNPHQPILGQPQPSEQKSCSEQRLARPRCQEHPGSPLEFFCEDCNKLSCGKCLTIAHNKHDFQHIDYAIPKHLDLLRGLVQPAYEVAYHAEEKMGELLREKNEVTANREKTARVVEAFFDKMSRALEDRKKTLISTLLKYTDIQLTRLDEHNQTLENAHSAIYQIVSTIEHSLQHSQDPDILLKKQIIEDSLDNHQESILKVTQLASESRQSTLSLQFSEDTSLLLPLSDLGTLHVCTRDPRSNYVSILGQVVVSDDDSNIYVAADGKETVRYVSFAQKRPPVDDTYATATLAPSLPPKPTFPPETPRTTGSGAPALPPKPTPPTLETPLTTGSGSSGIGIQSQLEDPPRIATIQQPMACSSSETESISEESEGEYADIVVVKPPLPLRHPRHRSSNQEIPFPLPQEAPIIDPVMIMPNHQLCSPNSGEQVYPCGVCCTGHYDNLIITDTFNHCLRLIDYTGEFVEKIGHEGKAAGQFMEPVAVAISKEDNCIFVTERGNTRVQKFTSHGTHLLKFGQRVLYGHQFNDPWGVAVSPADGDIYVSDWDKNRVYIYKPNGRYVGSIGKEGFIKFKFPAGIAFDNQGRLLVADRGNHCIWCLTADGTQIMGKIGSGFLRFPYGVSATSNGSIVITESGKDRISIFSASGELIRCFGRSGSEPGMFDHPRHVCINRKGQIIVADEMNQRLQIFELPEVGPSLADQGALYEELPPLYSRIKN